MAINQNEVRAECEAQPGFVDGNAYSRAKVCCRVLTQAGQAVPSWMVVREIIGKGSSGDISRGIKDFREEHGERLRQMDGIVPGLPTHLAPMVTGLWEAAVTAARAEFAANTRRWQEQIDQHGALADQATQKVAASEAVIEKQRVRLEFLDATVAGLDEQVNRGRAGREQAERMFETHTAEMRQQREKLEAALKDNKVELEKALERFDAERRYSLLQIEEARTKAANEVAAIRAQARHEKASLEMDVTRLTGVVSNLTTKLNDTEVRSAVVSHEVGDLRARLTRTEAERDRLVGDSNRMLSLIKEKATFSNILKAPRRPKNAWKKAK
jgi:hypothetical protein